MDPVIKCPGSVILKDTEFDERCGPCTALTPDEAELFKDLRAAEEARERALFDRIDAHIDARLARTRSGLEKIGNVVDVDRVMDPEYQTRLDELRAGDPPLYALTLLLVDVPQEVVELGQRLLASLGFPRTHEERQTRERLLAALFATYRRA